MFGQMFPSTDLMGFSSLMQTAMQNPEAGAQLFAMMGMEPPAGGVGMGPSVNPFAGPFAPQATPNERVAQGFESTMSQPSAPTLPVPSATPQGPSGGIELGSNANPFPTPMPGANPFPTPYGNAGGAEPQATGGGGAKTGPSSLAQMLRGVSTPSAPEPQRVSSPSAPQPRPIDQNSQIVAMLTKMMSGQKDPMQMLRLAQTAPLPTAVQPR